MWANVQPRGSLPSGKGGASQVVPVRGSFEILGFAAQVQQGPISGWG